MTSPIPIKIVFLVKNIPRKKITGSTGFTGKLCQTCKEEMKPILNKLFQKLEEELLPSSF